MLDAENKSYLIGSYLTPRTALQTLRDLSKHMPGRWATRAQAGDSQEPAQVLECAHDLKRRVQCKVWWLRF